MREPLGDREASGGMDAPVADPIAPARVVLVELASEPNAGPARTALQIPDAALDEPFSRGVAGVQAVAWNA